MHSKKIVEITGFAVRETHQTPGIRLVALHKLKFWLQLEKVIE